MELARRLLEPANLLSLVRLPLAALVWAAPESRLWIVGLGVLAAVTDWLDGYVGRRALAREPVTGTAHIGAWLDPLCDKAFVLSAAVAILVTYDPSWTVVGLVVVRDVALLALVPVFRMVAGPAAFHAHDFRAAPSGKVTTVAQFFTLLAVMFWPPAALPLAVVSGASGAYAVVVRVVRAYLTAHPPAAEARAPV